METGPRSLPFVDGELETSDVSSIVEEKILVGDGGIGEKGAGITTRLIAAIGRISEVQSLDGVIWDGSYAKEGCLRTCTRIENIVTYENAVVPRPSWNVLPIRTPLALKKENLRTVITALLPSRANHELPAPS